MICSVHVKIAPGLVYETLKLADDIASYCLHHNKNMISVFYTLSLLSRIHSKIITRSDTDEDSLE